jgi:hypothetical protein
MRNNKQIQGEPILEKMHVLRDALYVAIMLNPAATSITKLNQNLPIGTLINSNYTIGQHNQFLAVVAIGPNPRPERNQDLGQ